MATFNFPAKTYQAGQHVVGPFTMPTGVDALQVAFTVASPDISDPSETLEYEMDYSRDGGVTWLFDNGFGGWIGGQLDKHGNPAQPFISVNGLSHLAGFLCRIILTTTKPMTTAIQVVVS